MVVSGGSCLLFLGNVVVGCFNFWWYRCQVVAGGCGRLWYIVLVGQDVRCVVVLGA